MSSFINWSNSQPIEYVDNTVKDCNCYIHWDNDLGWVHDGKEEMIEKLHKGLQECAAMTNYSNDFLDDIKGDIEIYGANPEKGITGTVKVTFNDGRTETSNCYEPDEFDPEYGVALCILKHAMGGTARFYRVLRHGIKKYRRQVEAEEVEKKAKEEKEAVEKRRYEKRTKEKARRDARRAEKEREQKDAEREEKIDILAEAIARAKEKARMFKRGR